MSTAITYEVPQSRDALVAAFGQVDHQISSLWKRIDAEHFFELPTGDGWSVAANVAHLTNTTQPVTRALRLPRIGLRLLFGTRRSGSRNFVEMRDTYRRVLAAGGTSGKFTPQRRPPPENPAEVRDRLLQKRRTVVPELAAAIDRWDEPALDRYQLPHPLLGKLSIREMLFFTLYHLGHHAEVVAARHP